MKKSKTFGKSETLFANLGITIMNILPHNLHVNQIDTVVLDKVNDCIKILWKEQGNIYAFEGTYKKVMPRIMQFKQQIIKRPRKEDRIELWECQNQYGVYDWDVEQKIRKMRRID